MYSVDLNMRDERCEIRYLAQHHSPVHHVESIFRVHEAQRSVRAEVRVTNEAIDCMNDALGPVRNPDSQLHQLKVR